MLFNDAPTQWNAWGFYAPKKGPGRASKSSHHSVRAPPILTNNTTLNRRKCEDLNSNHGFCVERQFSVLFLVMHCDGFEARLFDHGIGFLFFQIENTKVRAWGSIITSKSKFTNHTFRGGVGRLQNKDLEDPCSRLLRDRLCPEAFMVARRTSHSWHWHHPGSVFKGSVLSIILNPRSRLTIA